jgi:DNA-binding PadR family transcriptional regulator
MEDLKQFLPLSPAMLHILLALASEDRHGYGIMREIARQSNAQYTLGPGTLYDNLQRLMDGGLVKEVLSRSTDEDPRRRYYRLTAFGRRVLSADLVRLKGVLREAKLHLHPPDPSKAS